MAYYYELPGNEAEAKYLFNNLLNRPDETLVLILGNDLAASEAVAEANDIINKDQSFFSYVNFVAINNLDIVMDELQYLDISKALEKKHFSLDDMDDYVLISISPFSNIISEAVTKSRFLAGKGSLTTAILFAMQNI